MEHKAPWLPLLGALVALLWALDYWKILWRRPLPVGGAEARRQAWRTGVRWLLFLTGAAGWGALSYSLSQPRVPREVGPSSREVKDIMLVVDVSRSMLAEDMQPNRMEATKRRLREFARKRLTDRVGLVLFSEKVFTLMPLSSDPALLDKVIGDVGIGYLGSGTNIGDGLALGVARLAESEAASKIIILLSDGVANVGNLTPIQAAEEARKLGIKVYTIGVGTQGEARMPVGNSVFGKQYQLIPGGSIDYKTLTEVSRMTGGKFYPATDEAALEKFLGDIDKLERTEIKVENQVIYDELYYSWFAGGLALILLAEALRRLALKEAV